ncbi:MAG: hypothetical protein WC269_05360 [Candidatus Gracilibacteria bacterium]|jgi:hypothetical protein
MPLKQNEKITWKKGTQRCCVFISVEEKTYQVNLDEEKQNAIISFLPNLFEDRIIKIISEEFPIIIPKFNKEILFDEKV